jgi:transcriptional regulatory protein RtcR
MKTIVFSFLGSQLDAAKGRGRWEKWRPNVGLCQHEDFIIDKLVLFYNQQYQTLLEQVVADIAFISPETVVEPYLMPLANPWDFEEVYGALYQYARHYPFDIDKHQYLIHITTGTHVAQICLFLLTETRYFPAKILQSSPPRKQQHGQVGTIDIIDLDLSRYNLLASRFADERLEIQNHLKSGIATKNPTFNVMIAEIEQVALRSRSPVLLLGATGVGKSFLARRVYELKKQRHQLRGTFVEVNCATLRGDSAMSALFGHAKGAFTGAVSARAGLLRSADGGLLFLDEIGELGADEQAMLLKAIEEKRFYPVGSDKEVQSDFQLIAGTCRDLAEEVRLGNFREDLFARLNMWTFHLPPLSQRREDIEPNIQFELTRFAQEQGREVRFNKEAWSDYLHYALTPEALWKGNFRDLSASVSRLATLADGGRIRCQDVEREITRLQKQWQHSVTSQFSLCQQVLGTAMVAVDEFDLYQLEGVLTVCRQSHSLSEAGRKLFAQSRQQKVSTNDADRLKKYLARFDLTWEQVQTRH